MGDRLKGRVAVVTGSGQGVGRAIAIAMAKEGAKVVTNNRQSGSTGLTVDGEEFDKKLTPEEKEGAHRIAGDAETTAKAIRDMGGEAVPFFGDVSSFEVADRLIQTAVDKFGKVDILVNNAGTFGHAPVWEMTEELWDRVALGKPKSYFNCIRYASPIMKEQRWGRIINCSSTGWLGSTDSCCYSAANAGVVGLSRAVAIELYEYGITCNVYCPNAVTRASVTTKARARITTEAGGTVSRGPARLLGVVRPQPEAIGPFIVYLATDEAAHISGTVFGVGGSGSGFTNVVRIYSEPEPKKAIEKETDLWTVDELVETVPRTLLEGYKSPAA